VRLDPDQDFDRPPRAGRGGLPWSGGYQNRRRFALSTANQGHRRGRRRPKAAGIKSTGVGHVKREIGSPDHAILGMNGR
jgi:hypothetical protein